MVQLFGKYYGTMYILKLGYCKATIALAGYHPKFTMLRFLFMVLSRLEFLFNYPDSQWRAQGGGEGAQAPAPLRYDTKVPLRSGLCDMNDIVDEIGTAAVCVGHQVPGGHHPSCSKKKQKKTWRVIPAPATARASCLRLNADDHNQCWG